eukprot:CAMPEP_0195085084 /NCGR_PEP_ID=MMETSP0448-20130528/25586_1 /TAXON_ID=66468 /ORGANISM="Heterocapsa triquestra, Strain CCMP 448" /LENGTH=228 /DNA_ID=CAMNT_0040118461 /DNA_START=85 /DNA_END=771 /DNA_ORIENTATION=-
MSSDALTNSIAALLSMDMGSQRAALRGLAEYPVHKEVPRKLSISRASTCASGIGGSDMSDSCSDPGSVGDVTPKLPCPGTAQLSLVSAPLLTPPGLPALSAAVAQAQTGGPQAKGAVCTLKIKNLPRRCSQAEILKAVEEIGFGNGYDFFFLPVGPQSKQNRGYAFMNFRDPVTAANFRAAFSGYRIREKVVEVVAAPVQGLIENMMRYSMTHDKVDTSNPKVLVLSL